MKLSKIKLALANILAQFEKVSTDKGLLSSNDDEIVVGSPVFLIDEEGNEKPAEDGEYTAEDGTIYVVEGGKITEIREVEKSEDTGDDVQPEEDTEEIERESMAEEEEPSEESDPKDEQIANLESEVARLEEELGAAKAENEQLKQRIAELEEKSAAEPAEESFEKVTKVEKTGNKRLDRLSGILNAK